MFADPLDMEGKEFEVGQLVVKSVGQYSGQLRIYEVSRVERGYVYLERSPMPLRRPELVLILADKK